MKALLISALFIPVAIGAKVNDAPQLIAAVNGSADGTVIELAEGRYELAAPLVLKAGTTLKGAGAGKTIITHTPPTPRNEGLFGYDSRSDFSSHVFKNNIVECIGQARPLFRNDESGKAEIENNVLTNVSDTARYENQKTRAKAGLESPLKFKCGVNGEMEVDGWEFGEVK